MKYKAYTDGSYQSSVGTGGYASVILDENNNVIKIICNGYKNTTNNRMELLGIIETLRCFQKKTDIEIVSDSQYVIKSITEGHALRWLQNKDFDKKNLDLWFELVDLVAFHDVSFTWVKGHNGDKWNELADLLATHGAKCLNISEDKWNQK
jgi:ribonuclease HI